MSSNTWSASRTDDRQAPLPYTASPTKLVLRDIFLCLKYCWAWFGILFPLTPWKSGKLDELFPSAENIGDVVVHVGLVVLQIYFLISLPIFAFIIMVPVFWFIAYVITMLVVNYFTCKFYLNGFRPIRHSKFPIEESEELKKERWIFINGIGVGHHWLQSNLDRLSQTFGRRITSVNNPTHGLIFDIIECLIQRCFNYATEDIRTGYAMIKNSLLTGGYKKVVLILHSQGGIEGGMIMDWLLAELPPDAFRNLEIYSFANAANHFNNPNRAFSQYFHDSMIELRPTPSQMPETRCIPYIEHYANSGDFVSLWGVLSFAGIPNRYMGEVFIRKGSGHLLNQHYLDTMFPLGPDGRVCEHNKFIDSTIKPGENEAVDEKGKDEWDVLFSSLDDPTVDDPLSPTGREALEFKTLWNKPVKVRDHSRLWQYRNGGSPKK